MKMRMMLTALCLAVLSVACSDKETDNYLQKGDTKAVYLQIKNKKGKSRSPEASEDGESADLLSAIIYFMDGSADPLVYDVRTVGAGGADAPLAELEGDGILFEDIPSSVTQVYVVGNYNSSDAGNNAPTFPTADGTTLSDIQAVVLNIEQVAHGSLEDGTTHTGLLTVMDGLAPVVPYSSNTGGWGGSDEDIADEDSYAEVELTPINSRIEIAQLTYTGTAYTSFTVQGIYINYYYQNLPLSLDTDGYAVFNSGSNGDLYDPDSPSYEDYESMLDVLGEPVTLTAPSVTPDIPSAPANPVWAYHVFGNSSPVPHIILKLTDVVTAGGVTLTTPRYVTVTGFMNGAVEVTTFVRNTIYRIADLAFDDGDIDVLPETESINVWVHVTVAPWETEDVTPII